MHIFVSSPFWYWRFLIRLGFKQFFNWNSHSYWTSHCASKVELLFTFFHFYTSKRCCNGVLRRRWRVHWPFSMSKFKSAFERRKIMEIFFGRQKNNAWRMNKILREIISVAAQFELNFFQRLFVVPSVHLPVRASCSLLWPFCFSLQQRLVVEKK